MPCWQAIILDHSGVDNYHGLTHGIIRLDCGEPCESPDNAVVIRHHEKCSKKFLVSTWYNRDVFNVAMLQI